MNIKAFNLASRTNETRYILWQETCACKCRLDASLCNNKQRWNGDKWLCMILGCRKRCVNLVCYT